MPPPGGIFRFLRKENAMSDKIKGRSDDQMKCVYMGPPMRKNPFASLREKLAGSLPEKKNYPESFADAPGPEKPELEEVYMGPPVTEEPEAEELPLPEAAPEPAPAPDRAAEPDPRLTEGVYAGPQVPPMAPVYAGPEMMSGPRDDAPRGMEGPRMEALYAAPRRPQPSEMMMVYAGPDFFSNGKYTQTPMMMAYAGPQFNMQLSMAEQMKAAQKQAEEERDRKLPQNPEDFGKDTFCPNCGSKVKHGRFCTECGALLPETLRIFCPNCGANVPKDKFCRECGTELPQDEESGSEA